MLYVSHPCADILKNAIEKDEYSEDRFIKIIYKTFTFINDYDILPYYGNPQHYEYDYEYEVIRRHIYNKLQVWAISEDDILRLCPEYLHMNRSLIMGLINEDAERIEAAEIEHDYETGYYEPREYRKYS
jgi:hypothetical protein